MQSLANGTELGAYTIVRLIGRGGMGEVYEAYEHRLQRRVALKVIAPQKAGVHGEVDLVRRFLQEARTLAQINHPNVVTIYAIDSINDIQFIAMEFVDGALFKDIFSLFALSADESAPIFLQLLEGLKCLHEHRILHRDIKPHNLMIRPNGQVKILDFGIAKRLGDRDRENTTVGVVVGTLAYLPPEVLYGQPANQRSDLWSLGAIFYECLVGQPLVSIHSTKVKGIRAATDSDVVFPNDSLNWIPQEMRAIIGKLCDRRPEARYGTASEAIAEIQRFIQKRPPVPPPTFTALYRAIENLAEIRLHADTKNLTSPKSKRELALTVLGDAQKAADDHQHHPEDDGPQVELADDPRAMETSLATEITKDSISARRAAQKRNRRSRQSWQWPVVIAVGLFVLVAGVLKLINNYGASTPRDPVPVKNTPVAEAPRLTAPSMNQSLWLEPTQIPTMGWSKMVEAGDYELQIASDKDFNLIVIREEVSGNSYRPSRILPEGEYYWQLYPKHSQTKASVPGKFTISILSPIELAWPREDQVYELPRGHKTQDLNFSWKCKPGAGGYRVQVSVDSEFNNVSEEKVVSTCAWDAHSFVPGTYYWRVRVEHPTLAQEVWSEVRGLEVRVMVRDVKPPVTKTHPTPPPAPTPPPHVNPVEKIVLHPPRLKNPKTIMTLQFGEEPARDVASLRKQIVEVPVFRWNQVPGARGYNVQIAWTPDFSKLISEENISGLQYEWRQVVPGQTFWRVRATKDGGALGPFSQSGELDVRLPEPKLKLEYKLADKSPLTWDPVPLADKYVVRWSPDRNLASVSEKVTDSPEIVLESLPPKVYVRVASASSAGERVSGFSTISTVTIEVPIRLGAPGLKTPPVGARVPAPRSGRISVVFSWTKIEKAEGYVVEISSTPDFTKILQKKSVKPTHWLLKGAKISGKLYWRVRAEGTTGPSAWSSSGSLEVR